MFKQITNYVKSAFDPTDDSAEVHDLIAIAILLGFIFESVASCFVYSYMILTREVNGDVIKSVAVFNAQQFGVGGAAIIAAIGTAGWLKGKNTDNSNSKKQEPVDESNLTAKE